MVYYFRVESQLPSIFYKYIDKVPAHSWMKYIRFLGMSESDISTVNSSNRGLQESKYQILNRWKMYIGKF